MNAVQLDPRWNKYRSEYRSMSHQDHATFMEGVFRDYTNQQHYDEFVVIDLCKSLFNGQSFDVVEMGGWKGELAAKVLVKAPDIKEWFNFEICRSAVEHSECKDERYFPCALLTPIWRLCHHRVWCSGLFIASHVIEHLSMTDFCLLAGWLRERRTSVAHFQAPLEEQPPCWDDYGGSHILPIGWDLVEKIMWENHFKLIEGFGTNRTFRYDP